MAAKRTIEGDSVGLGVVVELDAANGADGAWTLMTPVSAKIAVAPVPGTVAGSQLDDVVKDAVVPTRVWAAMSAATDRGWQAKPRPQRFTLKSRMGRCVGCAIRLER